MTWAELAVYEQQFEALLIYPHPFPIVYSVRPWGIPTPRSGILCVLLCFLLLLCIQSGLDNGLTGNTAGIGSSTPFRARKTTPALFTDPVFIQEWRETKYLFRLLPTGLTSRRASVTKGCLGACF